MVVDTEYYDVLGVHPTADSLEIKKAYRRLAIKEHPDKNPSDPSAHQKFQEIGEAYQVLSNENLRVQYDKYGKERAKPDDGFADPAEFFAMIFGGEAFRDWIGEISLMKDLTKTMEITKKEMEEEENAAIQTHDSENSREVAGTTSQPTNSTPGSNPRNSSAWSTRSHHLQLENSKSGEAGAGVDVSALSEREKELKAKEKKKGRTKEQRDELAAYQRERKEIREERVNTLSRKLIDRISILTETDKSDRLVNSFKEKNRIEIEHLKMESFGLEILHAIGQTYVQKAHSFIKSQKFLGIPGFVSRLRNKGTVAKDTWDTISTAIDAQMTMEEMTRLEEKGGDDWTREKKVEYERRVTGKILGAAWRGSRLEIQSVLRDVCDKVLYDTREHLDKRMERAHAMNIVGEMFLKATRTPEEEGDFMAFEQLMAEGAAKKEKTQKTEMTEAEKAENTEKKEKSRASYLFKEESVQP